MVGAAVLVLLVAGPVLAEGTAPAQPSTPMTWVGPAVDVVLKICAILFPIFWAFYRHDKDALQRLMASIPDIYDVVQQERRKLVGQSARTQPIERAMELARGIVGKPLTTTDQARVRAALQAHHERVKAAGLKATPIAGVGPALVAQPPPAPPAPPPPLKT
jgi:hypothetical protein